MDDHPTAEAGTGPGVALVTGGGRGVGRAIALGLARAGFAIAIVARSARELEETRALIEGAGARAAAETADVRDLGAVERAVRAVERALGTITTLVNNAGTGLAIGPFWEVDPDDWWTDVETSVRGTFNLSRAVIPGMLAHGRGRILNVSSYAAVRPAPYHTGYASGKAAVASLTESLAASLAGRGVQVFAITPGFVDTKLTRHLVESPEGRRWLPDASGRDSLDVELCARLAVDLALGRADALSGRFLHALDDVGELLRRIDEIERESLYVTRLRRLPGA